LQVYCSNSLISTFLKPCLLQPQKLYLGVALLLLRLSFPYHQFHEQQALDSEKSGNWFAAAFHLKSILNIKKDDTAAQQRLDKAQKMLSSQRK